MPDFDNLRFAALAALVVCAAPVIMADLLAAAWGGDVSAGSRAEVIDVLVAAVRILPLPPLSFVQ